MSTKYDFNKLEEVNKRASTVGVSYTMHYCGSDETFYFEIISATPTEEWQGKNRSFDIAIERTCTWLDTLIKETI